MATQARKVSALKGGPKNGSGYKPLPGALRRRPVGIGVTAQQRAELDEIAAAWDVPRATVAWALIESELQRYRRTRAGHGAILAALLLVARALRDQALLEGTAIERTSI